MFVTMTTRALTNLLGLPVARQVLVEGSSATIISLMFKMALFGAVIGGVVGLGQSIVLSRWLEDARWWGLYTLAGWAIGLPLVISITQLGTIGMTPLLFGGFIGGATGLAQWFLLRKEMKHSFWWLPVSIAAEGIGRIAQLGNDPTGNSISSVILGSLCVSLITASVLAPLLFKFNRPVVDYILPDWYKTTTHSSEQ